MDDLNEILSKWTILEARTVLNDLEKRLKFIHELQHSVEKKSDEKGLKTIKLIRNLSFCVN